jgi:hypothetical protein
VSDVPSIAVRPDPGISPEQARDARAVTWAFVLECYAKKNPAADPSGRGKDGTETKEDSAYAGSIQGSI